jgi:hypothetical protein
MICPTCGANNPEGLLACRACAHNAAVKALLDYQLPFIKLFESGTLQIGCFQHDGSTHLKMFGPHHRSLCGVESQHHPRKQSFLARTDGRLNSVCLKCRQQLTELKDRARVE